MAMASATRPHDGLPAPGLDPAKITHQSGGRRARDSGLIDLARVAAVEDPDRDSSPHGPQERPLASSQASP